MEFESWLGTALLTQTVTGDRTGVIGFGTQSSAPVSLKIKSMIFEKMYESMFILGFYLIYLNTAEKKEDNPFEQ